MTALIMESVHLVSHVHATRDLMEKIVQSIYVLKTVISQMETVLWTAVNVQKIL
jgi:hypothetical protein